MQKFLIEWPKLKLSKDAWSMDHVEIFLPDPVFSHGQLYVAFSRAHLFKDIYVQVMQTNTQSLFGTKTTSTTFTTAIYCVE